MVLSSCIARVHLVHAMTAAQRQVAADFWATPIGSSHDVARRLHVYYTPITIYY